VNGNNVKVDSECRLLRPVLKGNDSNIRNSILWQGENEYELYHVSLYLFIQYMINLDLYYKIIL
jgi:hypothetical protein